MSEEENHSNPVLLQIKQAAVMLGVSPRTIWRMIADRQLTPVRFRRCTRVYLEEVVNFMKASCV
jgi:excisionase family DNA binding protein